MADNSKKSLEQAPFDLEFEAEQALLGFMLVNNEMLIRVSNWGLLKPEFFRDPLLREIYVTAAVKLITFDDLDARVPLWMKDKDRTAPPPLWETLDEEGFFDKLENAGGHALSHGARIEISTMLRHSFDRDHQANLLSKRKLNAKMAEALANRIEETLTHLDFLFRHPNIELPLRLREYAQQEYSCIPSEVLDETLFGTPGPELSDLLLRVREAQERLEPEPKNPKGRTRKDDNDQIINECAKIYHRIGGRVAIGGGGFSRFLQTIWEKLPNHPLRCATATAFVDRAENYERDRRGLPQLGSLVRGLPRDLLEKGSPDR